MRLRRSHALAGLGVLMLAALAFFVLRGRTAAVRYVTAPVTRGDVLDVVGATGTLQAVTTVQVGSQVSGTIQALYADFNSVVRKGPGPRAPRSLAAAGPARAGAGQR